jgi:hypothetical protein
MNNNKNKNKTFKENLENPKLGYYKYKGVFVFSYLIEQ